MRRRRSQGWLLLTVLLLLGPGCGKRSFGLDDRPCRGDDCSDGYVCNPLTGRCGPKLTVDCESAEGTCPYRVRNGDSCTAIGAFLPCIEGRADCLAGCRTCQEAGTWSACSPAECVLGSVWSCATCDEDCRTRVRNATPVCDVEATPAHCSYTGECRPGGVDRDGVPDNGCECLPTIDGVEVCDGEDNNCDGTADEGATCGPGQICDDGRCRDCTASDPGHCGPSCLVCADPTPACFEGNCRCTPSSCGATSHCRSDGTCEGCTATDPNHCGAQCKVCSGTSPICSGGNCVCETGSCGVAARCKTDGTCAPCNESAYCGEACTACPTDRPVCAGGNCKCDGTSCPAGNYCAAGVCSPCNCPAMFPACVDTGAGSFVCRCDATSCGTAGSCVDAGATCELDDACSSSSGLLSVCTVADDSAIVYSSWARGTPSNSGTPGCRSAGGCWATNLTGNYNSCERSCVKAAPLNLAGVTGTVSVSFWAAYAFEWGCCDYEYPCGTCGHDGVTPRFLSNTGWETVTPVSPPWDIANVRLDTYCMTSFSSWPAYASESSGNTRAYNKISFQLSSASAARFFHAGFAWRVYLQSDFDGEARGWTMDDIQVRVTESP